VPANQPGLHWTGLKHTRSWLLSHFTEPDLRGHGKSERTSGRYRLQDYANDTIAFLQQKIAEPALVVGHSLGGMIALLVAAQCPSCVRTVAMGDAPLPINRMLKFMLVDYLIL